MNTFEKIQDIIEAIKQVSAGKNAPIRFQKTFASGTVLKISIRSEGKAPELEGLGPEELNKMLGELEDKLETLENEEPEEDSTEHDQWEEKVFDLEEQIDEVESAIDELEDVMDADFGEGLDEDWED